VVPMDGTKRSAWAAMQAASIARKSGAELLLVHVIRHPEVVGDGGPESEARRTADHLVELNMSAARAYLERQQASLASYDLPVRYRLEANSNVPEIISRVVEEEEGSLVVVSAHGCSPGTGWPYGTVVGSLLAYGTRPILVLQDLPQRRAPRVPPGRVVHARPASRPPV
jgi:nucleotide-binding universal stress UspA family protein